MKSFFGGVANAVQNLAPVPYVPRSTRVVPLAGQGYGLTNAGPEVQMRSMGSVGTLYAIVNRTSNATAAVEWKLFKSAKSGNDDDRVEVTKHPALDIWAKPNPFMTRQEFVESFQQHLDLTGEAWWLTSREGFGGSPSELWPVRPDRMQPLPDPELFIKGYEYMSPDGDRVPLDVGEVIFLRMPNPLDIYRGMGPVQAILVDLDSTRYSAEWNRNFFLNSAEPGGIIQYEERLSDGEFDEVASRWREQHQGTGNAHRVAIIEQGKWVSNAVTQRDMQFVELRNVSREVIREAFGFPKPMLGATDDVNRANAEAAEVVFARWLVVPRLERIKQALNNDFLPMFKAMGVGLEFDYENPVPDDRAADNLEMTAKSNAAKVYIELGFTPTDVCDYLELPEMEFEKPEPPPAPTFGAPPSTEPPSAPDAPPGPPVPDDAAKGADGLPADAATNMWREWGVPQVANSADEVDITPAQVAWESALAALVKAWGPVRAAQIDALAEQISAAINHGDFEALASLSAPTDDAATLLAAAMESLGEISAGHVSEEARAQGADVKPATPNGAETKSKAHAFVKMMAATLALAAGREALRIYRAKKDGKEVAEEVATVLHEAAGASVQADLGTALSNAQNAARFTTLLSGPTAALYASEKNDKNTCKPCAKVDGRWLGNSDGLDFSQIEKVYPSTGYVDCLGRDRCRGTVVGVWRKGVGG